MEDPHEILDPIAAYDQIAPYYVAVSERRRAYLDAIDELILERIPATANSLLDAGAGDGRRTLKIAERAGIKRVVVLEPSAAMRNLVPPGIEIWPDRLERVTKNDTSFDVILCLWNVLGHLNSEADCRHGLKNLRRLSAPGGRIFVDVVNRYNLSECGPVVVAARISRDWVTSSWKSGEVGVRWPAGEKDIQTRGHVFTDAEMRKLFAQSGLTVDERLIVDYQTGLPKTQSWAGSLFYSVHEQL